MFIIEIDPVQSSGSITHTATSWQVSLTPGFEDENIVFESLKDSENLNRIKVPLPLTENDIYYSRTKLHFSDGTETDWNRPNVITRNASGFNFADTIVETPKLSVEFDRHNAPLGGFKVYGSPFKLFMGIGKHKYTTWIIEDDKGQQIWSRIHDKYNLTSVRIPSGILKPGRMYIIKAIYITDTNAYSNTGKLRIVTNASLVDDPAYLANINVTDLKAFETNTALLNLTYTETPLNELMEQLVALTIENSLLRDKLGYE